jgi:hypothetical protein
VKGPGNLQFSGRDVSPLRATVPTRCLCQGPNSAPDGPSLAVHVGQDGDSVDVGFLCVIPFATVDGMVDMAVRKKRN